MKQCNDVPCSLRGRLWLCPRRLSCDRVVIVCFACGCVDGRSPPTRIRDLRGTLSRRVCPLPFPRERVIKVFSACEGIDSLLPHICRFLACALPSSTVYLLRNPSLRHELKHSIKVMLVGAWRTATNLGLGRRTRRRELNICMRR